MKIECLAIELTRRCNMTCSHCMRGDVQDKDIASDILSSLLVDNEVTSIQSLIFTGGEPSIYGQGVDNFISLCTDNNITIGNFYIAVNGKVCSDEFLVTMSDLYDFCTNKEQSKVDITRSSFHIGQDEDVVAKLKTLPFVYEREEFMLEDDYIRIRKQGRAEDPAFEVGEDIKPQTQTLWNGVLRGIVYLNVNGDICNSCDLSYANQEINKIGNITEETLSEMLT